MKKFLGAAALLPVLLLLGIVGAVCAQSACDSKSLEKQQANIARRVEILRINFNTFWTEAFPNGMKKPRDREEEREQAWRPKLDDNQNKAVSVNNGLGCIIFIKPSIPALCAPIDVQANLAMEALRDDWENGKIAPKGSLLEAMRESIPSIWAEEKTMCCVLKPDAQYIDLSDKLQKCTPAPAE